MVKALNDIEIKKKINDIYNDKICLDGFEYKGMLSYSKFKCNVCGNEWKDKPINVLRNIGCLYCRCNEFIKESKEKFGDRFDYSKCHSTYKGRKEDTTLICKKHNNEFSVKPYIHLLNKNGGCKLCSNEAISLCKTKDTRHFIESVKEKFGDKFTFGKTEYKGQLAKTTITCKEHGDIEIKPKIFLRSLYGCSKCALDDRKIEQNTIIERFRNIHGDKYSYGEYNGIEKEMDIYCSIHGLFRQTPHNHLAKEGCPQCSNISKLENDICKALNDKKILFERQKRFEWSNRMAYDFYINGLNLLIECQGVQHFIPINFFGGEQAFKTQKERDKLKLDLSREHNIDLIYYCDKKYVKYYENTELTFFTDSDSLMNYIMNK